MGMTIQIAADLVSKTKVVECLIDVSHLLAADSHVEIETLNEWV
jgi:hypothetical protein